MVTFKRGTKHQEMLPIEGLDSGSEQEQCDELVDDLLSILLFDKEDCQAIPIDSMLNECRS